MPEGLSTGINTTGLLLLIIPMSNPTIGKPMLAVRCYSIYFLSYALLNQVQDFILGIFAPLNKSQKPRAISSIAIGP